MWNGSYSSDYDIFFKPHPADSSSAGYPDRFEGLTLLPGQMPFEIFVWALLDKIDMIQEIAKADQLMMEKLKAMKKDGELTEDDQKKAEKDIQDLTDKHVKKIDEMCAKKEKELMEI